MNKKSHKKFLFMTVGSFSCSNENLKKILINQFHDYEIEEFDLLKEINNRKILILINAIFIILEYLQDFLSGKKKIRYFRTYFDYTSFLFNRLSKICKQSYKNKSYVFTLQTQSMFDGSLKGTDHFIYTDHTNLANLNYPNINPQHYLKSKKYLKLETAAYHNATKIFTMSSNISQSLISQYYVKKDNILLVKAGPNVMSKIHEKPHDYKNKIILFVGIDWERKGGNLLIESFIKVLQTIPDATLNIIGCSPKIKIKNCNVIGRIPVDKVSYYYENATIFCLPTVREPFGIVFIEAMFHKLPIITNDIGATVDFVFNEYNGYRLNNKVEEYSTKIAYLLNNPSVCEQLGNNAYKIVENNYTWNMVGKRIYDHITNTIKNQVCHV